MKSSIECLNELKKAEGEEWKKKLSSYLKDEDDNVEKEELYVAFIDAYRENVIDNMQTELKKVTKEIDNDLLMAELKEYIDGTLSGYYAAEPLRVMDRKDYDTATRLVDAIFEQCILRFDPEFVNSYEEYGFHILEDFNEIIFLLDSLVAFLVRRNLNSRAMADAIYVNIRISKKLCQYIAERIDRSFDRIQMKLIVDKLYEK